MPSAGRWTEMLYFLPFQFPHRTSGPEEAQPRPDQSCFQEAICVVAEIHQEQNRRDRHRIRVCKQYWNHVRIDLEEMPAITARSFRFLERRRKIWGGDRSSNRLPPGKSSMKIPAETSNEMAFPIKALQWIISARKPSDGFKEPQVVTNLFASTFTQGERPNAKTVLFDRQLRLS